MDLSDNLYLELIRDTSAKGELFNDLINILNDQPTKNTVEQEEWEIKLFKKIKFIKDQVTLHDAE
jgi:hypothetical protein